MILNENYTLSNGVKIPKIGLGTWMINDNDVVQAVKDAVKIGYRHIDTAQLYAAAWPSSIAEDSKSGAYENQCRRGFCYFQRGYGIP